MQACTQGHPPAALPKAGKQPLYTSISPSPRAAAEEQGRHSWVIVSSLWAPGQASTVSVWSRPPRVSLGRSRHAMPCHARSAHSPSASCSSTRRRLPACRHATKDSKAEAHVTNWSVDGVSAAGRVERRSLYPPSGGSCWPLAICLSVFPTYLSAGIGRGCALNRALGRSCPFHCTLSRRCPFNCTLSRSGSLVC